MIGPEYTFEGEHAELATNRIEHAASQLPPDGPGIVVIDLLKRDLVDEDDVEGRVLCRAHTRYARIHAMRRTARRRIPS